MATSAQNSRRPVAVSSMSSLDSLIDAALDDKTTVLSDDQMAPVAEQSNVVSSSTLSSIGGAASPTHISSNVSEKGPPMVNDPIASSSMVPTGMLLSAPVVPSVAAAPVVPPPVAAQVAAPAPAAPNSNTVAEFLFQLSKMLTDDNTEIIEWSNGQINVHDPYRLQDEVLNKYFRHSKFASFQRQLNYFGFRKLAGKGKMAPCSYVNEATTPDIRSLLLIKRKTGATVPKEKGASGNKKRSRSNSASTSKAASAPVNPVLAGILHRTSSAPMEKGGKAPARAKAARSNVTSSSSQQEVARAAVGKGVRHSFLPSASAPGSATEALASASMIFPDPPQLGFPGIEDSLNELTNNYRNSLQSNEAPVPSHPERPAEEAKAQSGEVDPSFQMYNFLSRDSSLVDLAMLVPSTNVDSTAAAAAPEPAASVDPTAVNEMSASAMSFLDFPGMPSSEKDGSG